MPLKHVLSSVRTNERGEERATRGNKTGVEGSVKIESTVENTRRISDKKTITPHQVEEFHTTLRTTLSFEVASTNYQARTGGRSFVLSGSFQRASNPIYWTGQAA